MVAVATAKSPKGGLLRRSAPRRDVWGVTETVAAAKSPKGGSLCFSQ